MEARSIHGSAVPGGVTCNFSSDPNSGCGQQISGASYQRTLSNFASYATNNDTTITGTGLTRAGNILAAVAGTGSFVGNQINFDLPGVTYPEGDNPGSEVQAQSASLPTGCTYHSTGAGVNGTSPYIGCTSSAYNPTLSNIDFTNGGTDCVLFTASGVTGLITSTTSAWTIAETA